MLLRGGGVKRPLFLIHGVDGGLERLESLVNHLDVNRSIYGIRSQALVGEPVALTSVEDLAAFYLRDARAIQPHGPYYFLGFSFGGLIAFEMARGVHSMGEPVGMVGMLDNLRMAPAGSSGGVDLAPNRFKRRWKLLKSHCKRVLSVSGLSYAREKIAHRSLRIIYTVLDRINHPIPRFLQRPYDLNWYAAARYAPQHFPGKVTLFQAVASAGAERASNNLWARVAGGGVEIRQIVANHEGLMREPQVQMLARELADCMAQLP